MTPADIIRPLLEEADRRKPHLRIDNRFQSCGELLEDALALGGPDWRFIGKSSRRGEGGFRPSWFTPVVVKCRRPDGADEDVFIDLFSMDAAWYLPTVRQVKVIVNSTANELPEGDQRRGPAGLGSYDITPTNPDTGEAHYRWHNPPMPQRAGIVVPPLQPAGKHDPDRGEMMAAGEWLDAYYSSRDGLQRPNGLSIRGGPDWEGVGAWLFDVYFKARQRGRTVEEAKAAVIAEIRKAGGPTGEWQVKHPGERP